MGCYGHPLVRTPNLDRLAARGTRFTACWTPSPVCIPARASFATGKYIHQIGFWDNADPYDGSIPSWHHRLRDAGHHVVSIGKLHFRSDEDDCGFSESIIPMHVVEGKGDLLGLIRDDLPVRGAAYKMARMAGPGKSPYTQYDREIAARAQIWLREEAPKHRDKPWVLFVSFVAPHYPLTAPPEHFYRYFDDPRLPMPLLYERTSAPTIRSCATTRRVQFRRLFRDTEDVRRAVAGYYGLCSFMDEQAGKVLDALAAFGLSADTARHLHQRPRRRARPARPVGKVDAVRGDVRRAADRRRRRHSAGPRDRHAGQPGRHLSLHHRLHRRAGPAWSSPTIRASRSRGLPTASGRNAPCSANITAWVRPPAPLRSATAASNTSTTWSTRRSCSTSRRSATRPRICPQIRDIPRAMEVCEATLRALLSPELVDARAKRRQAEQLDRHGGREAVIARGDLGFSPPPGFRAEFH